MFYRLFQLTKVIFTQLGLAPGKCRFHPPCSLYSRQAIHTHGWVRGSFLTFKRVIKCHPWHQGGSDPVPPTTHLGRQS